MITSVTLAVDVAIKQKDREAALTKMAEDHAKMLRKVYPDARHITWAVVDRSSDNSIWKVEFYVG